MECAIALHNTHTPHLLHKNIEMTSKFTTVKYIQTKVYELK